jgi:hypothetical protein
MAQILRLELLNANQKEQVAYRTHVEKSHEGIEPNTSRHDL